MKSLASVEPVPRRTKDTTVMIDQKNINDRKIDSRDSDEDNAKCHE